MSRLLEIERLRIAFGNEEVAVKEISLHIDRGEIVGIAGPSGSGKSLTMWAMLGLLPDKAIMSGSLRFYNGDGAVVDINKAHEAAGLRGKKITMIAQNPFTSLNPVIRCGNQIMEMLDSDSMPIQEKRSKIVTHLRSLGFNDPDRIFASYPFELSGGQLQRIVIAIATICEPDLIIADEPTTALDTQTQIQVLELLVDWIKSKNKSMFLVSHDTNLLLRYCRRIYLMRDGMIESSGLANEMKKALAHEALSDAITHSRPSTRGVLCDLRGIQVQYRSRSGAKVDAVKSLSMQILSNEALGLIGGTGSGKSTIAKILTGLVRPDQGQILFLDKPLDYDRYPILRHQIQMIFQDPYSALYPHWTVYQYIREAIRHYHIAGKDDESNVIAAILVKVGLSSGFASRYPHQLSGGERQRVQIARAILLRPKLLICDEITSGLDSEIQEHILELLKQIHNETEMTLLVISHDLNVIRYLTTRVVVIHEGALVEDGEVNEVLADPSHEVTRALLHAGTLMSSH